ncbi:MAG: ribbon-helix-helix protein, CopG family [Clostridiales bacterium]|nr:ribbon-helix-helix protein, CopG family [Clostridiales bacterium]MDY4172957.1 ribbon-helix-helix protein, CopG family [Evtepia sp.]
MSIKTGRPKSDMPKDTMLRVRLDQEYKVKLDKCAEKLGISKSDVVRWGIDLVYGKAEK